MLTEIGFMLIGAIIAETIGYAFRRWRSRRVTTKEWYQQAISLVSHAIGICSSAKSRSDLNYGSIAEESQEISNRLREHVNPYPKTVDKESVQHIERLARLFSKVHATTEVTEEKSPMEALEELLEMATRESKSEKDADMGEALDQSTEHSPIMDEIFRESGLQPRVFGSKFRERLDQADSMEELFQSMSSGVGIDSKRIEKVLEDFAGKEWDDSLSLAIRVHLQLAESLSQNTVNHLSQASQMVAASSTDTP